MDEVKDNNYREFRRDLKVAIVTEKEIAKFVYEQFGWKTTHFERTKKYDILVKCGNKKTLKIECKEDFRCLKTGNIGIEFSYRGNPSGISTSEADLYAVKAHTRHGVRYIFIKKSVLLKMIENKLYHRIVNGGDKGSNRLNYLFSYYVFASKAEKIFSIENKKDVIQ